MHEETNILLAAKPQGKGPPEDLDIHCGTLKGILQKLPESMEQTAVSHFTAHIADLGN
jgi:hypothetical protein